MRILYLLDTLAPCESASQVLSLGPTSVRIGDTCEVCCLGPETPAANNLRSSGVGVHALAWSRWFDPRAIWNLRRFLDEHAPDAIHAWSLPALRVLGILNRQQLSRVVFSGCVGSPQQLAWWDRQLVSTVGVCCPRAEMPSQVADADGPMPLRLVITERDDAIAADQVEQPHRIVCAGWDDRRAGFRYAAWAIDFLRYHYPNIHLDIVGVEDHSGALHRLVAGLELTDYVSFHAPTLNLPEALANADVVWLPSVANQGDDIARVALKLGKPIVAFDVPTLRQTLRAGQVGRLVPLRDVTALTRVTHHLLRDPDARARLGEVARQHADLNNAENVASWRLIYQRVGA